MITIADQFFFTQFDPYFHFQHAELVVNAENGSPYRAVDTKDELVSELLAPKFYQNIEGVRLAAVRFIRYQQAETLLTVLLGSPPDKSVTAVSADPKIKIFGASKKIANREIPDGFEILHADFQDEFKDWIAYKITGLSYQDIAKCGSNIDDAIHIIVNEAQMFSRNQAFQAFKHGSVIGFTPPRIEKKIGEKFEPFFELNDDSVAWANCKIKRGQIKSYEFGGEELNQEQDLLALMFGAGILETIKSRAIAIINGEKEWTPMIPFYTNQKLSVPKTVKMSIQIR